MEQNILYSMGKEGASNLVSLLSKSLEPVVDMHNNDCVICSCGRVYLVANVPHIFFSYGGLFELDFIGVYYLESLSYT